MRAAFERYCENTIEVTMVVDPGTDREFSKSLTVPVGSLLNFRSDNPDRAIICDDPDVTVVTHFDGMQSRTFYILTEPSDEQVARYGELLQALQASRES